MRILRSFPRKRESRAVNPGPRFGGGRAHTAHVIGIEMKMKMTTKKRKAKNRPLFTIGYEQAKPAAVLNELKRAKIDLLVDTRAVAASRRPGFSKRQLAASLEEAGITYIHLQKLGTPAEGRVAARSGDTDALWRIYEKHIRKPEAQQELGELIALIESGKRIALLCYCRDPKTCHRSRIVANVRKRISLKVADLVPPLF
jgi:uncharacterized protein (DUF488 family)